MKSDDDSDSLSAGSKQVLEACSQIADCLVDRLLTLEEKAVGKQTHSGLRCCRSTAVFAKPLSLFVHEMF